MSEARLVSLSARALALAILACAAATQDSLQLKDGRCVSGPELKMTRAPEGIIIHLPSGDVTVPSDRVKAASASQTKEGAVENLSPEAKKNLEKGLVDFEGKWMRPDARDVELKRRSVAMQKRIAEAIEHSSWTARHKSESKYFAFEYTIDPEIMKGWAVLMDEYYATFTKFWGVKQPEGFGKLAVRFHHNPEKFYEVAGVPEGVGGFFRFVPPLELQFYFDRNDTDWTMNVMFHEANHYLVFLIDPKFHYPPWLSEGLAEYYGASVWDPKTKKLAVGGLLEGRVAQVQQDVTEGNWRTLDDMIKQAHPIGGEWYGWAWTFVHFMMNSKYEKSFRKFVTSLPRDQALKREREDYGTWQIERHPPDQITLALKRDLKVSDLKELEKEWHGYIKNLKPSSARGYYVFGRNALMNGMPIKARRNLEMALEKGYDAPMVYVTYARVLQQVPAKNADDRKKNLDLAKAQYEKVLAIDPIHPLYRADYAALLNRMAMGARKTDPEVEKQLKMARELGEYVEGGMWSYDVYLSTSWTPFVGNGN